MEAVRMVLICLDHPLFMKSSDYVNFTRTRKFDLHHAVHHGISPRPNPFCKRAGNASTFNCHSLKRFTTTCRYEARA